MLWGWWWWWWWWCRGHGNLMWAVVMCRCRWTQQTTSAGGGGGGGGTSMAAAMTMRMPVTASGELYSWGWAEHGNLGTHACVCRGVDVRLVLMNAAEVPAPVPPTGLSTTENQFTPRLVHTPAPVVSVTAGGAAVFALCGAS